MVKRWSRHLAQISVTSFPESNYVRVLITEQVMEKRADKRWAESGTVLLIAVTRIWRAHKNGRLLERSRSRDTKAVALKKWKDKLNTYRADEGGFSSRPCLTVY
jgi:hypothetical protein